MKRYYFLIIVPIGNFGNKEKSYYETTHLYTNEIDAYNEYERYFNNFFPEFNCKQSIQHIFSK